MNKYAIPKLRGDVNVYDQGISYEGDAFQAVLFFIFLFSIILPCLLFFQYMMSTRGVNIAMFSAVQFINAQIINVMQVFFSFSLSLSLFNFFFLGRSRRRQHSAGTTADGRHRRSGSCPAHATTTTASHGTDRPTRDGHCPRAQAEHCTKACSSDTPPRGAPTTDQLGCCRERFHP